MSLYQRKNYNLKVPNIVHITLVQNAFQNTHTKNVTTAHPDGIYEKIKNKIFFAGRD